MLVKDVMSKDLVVCTPQDSVVKAAKLMKAADVGAIPVVEDRSDSRLIGIVTDRDIAIQIVAEGRNPTQVKVDEVMSRDLATVKPDDELERAAEVMQARQVRRVPVVDENGVLIGMIAQADIVAESGDADLVKETVEEVSRPSKGPGREAA